MKKILLLLLLVFIFTSTVLLTAQVPTENLVGFWSFDGDVNDISAQGNDFIEHNVVYTTGRHNETDQCVYLNGTTAYLSNQTLDIDLNSNYSLSFWAKVDGVVANRIFCFSNSTTTFPIIGCNSASGNVYWSIRDDQSSDASGSQIHLPANIWKHFVFVKDGSTYKIYLDNVEISANNFSLGTFSSWNIFSVGALLYNGEIKQYLNGYIDDMALYSRALTESDITDLYNASFSTIPTTSFWTQSGSDIYNNNVDGNVGIGTTNTFGYKLAVNGIIGAKEVVVETTSAWPDFVFEPDYEIMTIADLTTFIKVNKHLPEIPTTEEVQENGISVGEMNAKLLEKIEELILYIIQLEERVSTLEDN